MGRAAVAAPVAGAAPKRSNQTIPGTKKTAGYRRFWSVRAGSVFPAAMAGNTPRHQNYCLSFCRALSSSRVRKGLRSINSSAKSAWLCSSSTWVTLFDKAVIPELMNSNGIAMPKPSTVAIIACPIPCAINFGSLDPDATMA